MGPNDPKEKPPVPVSTAPRTVELDDEWSDDIFAGTFELPGDDNDEHDRVTAIPDLPPDEYVAKAMKQDDDSQFGLPPAEPPPSYRRCAPEFEEFEEFDANSRRPLGPRKYSDSLDPPLPETLPPEDDLAESERITVEAPLPELDELDLVLDDDLDVSTLGQSAPPLNSQGKVGSLDIDLAPSEQPPPSREDPLVAQLKDSYAMGDFSGALSAAERLLERDPNSLDAARYAQSCRDVLSEMYSARVGPMHQTVHVAVAPERVRWLSLDHKAGFLLSLVDGQSTVEELLDICGMPGIEALRILSELLEQGILRVERS